VEAGIKKIKNFGKIQCSKVIAGVLRRKITENYGVIGVKEDPKEQTGENKHTKIANMGVLDL